MKKMNKLLALVLAMVMVLGLAASAFADEAEGTESEPQKYSITINNSTEGHTYEAYQIFTGDLSGSTLSNIVWGTGISADGQTALGGAAAKAESLKTEADAKAFAEEVAPYLATVAGSATAPVDGKYVISNLAAGYYLVKDQDKSLTGDNDSYTRYIVKVVQNTTADPKSSVPSFEKKLQDKNDTNGETTGWQDSADWDIGDKVPFQLKGTVASTYADYKTYYFAFHDIEEKGLTFDSTSVKVYVDGNPITSGYEVVTNTEDTCTFEVIFQDLKKIEAVHAGSVITVEYESELNSSANIGNQGNINQAKLEFSNNPNEEQGGEGKPETGETPWDYVIVFTYKTVINKVTKNPNYDSSEEGSQQYIPLSGAEFKLEKKMSDDTWKTISGSTNEAGDTFTFTGLDDGEYRLTETKTPAGYNTIDPITFTISADHTNPWIYSSDNRTTVLTSLNGNKGSGEITLTADKSTGALSADVVNNSGSTLPETGGIGTTIFYVLGGMLVVCAVVLMVSKKRMSAEG